MACLGILTAGGGDASSCLLANVYKAAFSQRQSLAKIQPAEAILSRVIFI